MYNKIKFVGLLKSINKYYVREVDFIIGFEMEQKERIDTLFDKLEELYAAQK